MTTRPERRPEGAGLAGEGPARPRARKFRLRPGQPLSGEFGPRALPPQAGPDAEAPPGPPAPGSSLLVLTRPTFPARALRREPQGSGSDPGGEPRATSSVGSDAAPAGSATGPDALEPEALSARQLRLARRVAQRHGLAVSSDLEAVRELRRRGIDPFEQASLMALIRGEGLDAAAAAPSPPDAPSRPPPARLPQAPPGGVALASHPAPPRRDDEAAARRASEIVRIQRDIVLRRQRRLALLLARLAVLVVLPTALAGWYFARVATPMYATRSEFVIQKAEAASMGAAGLGGLFQGTSMATQQDSMTVQAYLTSRAALLRLDAEHGFRGAFSDPGIDWLQRLPAEASAEDAYDLYQGRVRIAYDPTEGIVKMEVVAPDPQTSERFSRALIGYAEEQVDHLTSRLRGDQMADARDSYEQAEGRRAAALRAWLDTQAAVQQIDPVGETAARTAQISALETQRQQLELDLQARLSVPRPNAAQVEALRGQIGNIERLIGDLRAEMTQASGAGASLSVRNAELTTAEQDYAFQTLQVQQALAAMETAQVEANRQVRYLSLGVEPVAPDEPTYPRVVENTALAFLIFAGLYLMASLTASILREQVTS